MLNKKGQDLSIGTLILIVLGVIVLVLLVLGFSIGWSNLFEKINIFSGSSLGDVRTACNLAITSQNTYDYCQNFKKIKVNSQTEYVNCQDTRITPDGSLPCVQSSILEAVAALCQGKTEALNINRGVYSCPNAADPSLPTCESLGGTLIDISLVCDDPNLKKTDKPFRESDNRHCCVPKYFLMTNRKALQLAISTIILLVLGLLVLVAILVAVTGGFDRFKSTTSTLLDSVEGAAVRQACQISCDTSDRLSFCCTELTLNKEKIICDDSRLEINCNLNCERFPCSSENSDTFSLEYTFFGWPNNNIQLIIKDKKINLEETINSNAITKSKTLSQSEWDSLTSFFIESGIFNVQQSELVKCEPPNCPADGGGGTLKIQNKNDEIVLPIGSNIIQAPSSYDNVLTKINDLRIQLENS